MATNTAPISNPNISLKPSQQLKKYISNIKSTENLPPGITGILFKNQVNQEQECSFTNIDYLITEEDREFIRSLSLDSTSNAFTKLPSKHSTISSTDKVLSLQDVVWLYKYIQKENEMNDEKVYLHELIDGTEIILPKNVEVPRNKELDKRCQKLKAEQENREYHQMVKNVDSTKKRFPDDTIAYQLNQMNRHLVAIFQFILSVAAGFAFGFMGSDLIAGTLDYGFRLLLGVICALIIALAELYFLAKRLNEDLQFENTVEKQQKKSKLD